MQAFHRIKFAWNELTTLEIEWRGGEEGALLNAPDAPFLGECSAELLLDSLGKAGVPPICWRPHTCPPFEPLQLRENTTYLVDIRLPVNPDFAKERWLMNRSWPLSTLSNAYQTDPPKRWTQQAGGLHLTGILNFRSYAGMSRITIPDLQPVFIEVASAKIGYFDDFRALLDAIAMQFTALLLETEAPTFERFSLTDASEPQLLTFLFLLRHAMDEANLPAAVEMVLGSPRCGIESENRTIPLSSNRVPLGSDMVARMPPNAYHRGGPLADLFRGYTPDRLPETRKMLSVDTIENRYVKAFLENLLNDTELLAAKLLDQSKIVAARQVESWCSTISEWLRHPIWNDVKRMNHLPANSQVLQKAPGYRDVLQTDAMMRLALTLPWDHSLDTDRNVDGDLRPVSTLYEYWCFFTLREILRGLCVREFSLGGALIKETESGLVVGLKRGVESRTVLLYQNEPGRNETVTLYYNRKFQPLNSSSYRWDGSYSVVFNPDFSISIEIHDKDGSPMIHWMHFDAKYRLDVQGREGSAESLGTMSEASELPESGPTQSLPSSTFLAATEVYLREDLFKMHTYRDALLGSRGSYILFPGRTDDEDIFIRYPGVEYPNNGKNLPSVGAFQLNPMNRNTQVNRLRNFLSQSLAFLASASNYREEEGCL